VCVCVCVWGGGGGGEGGGVVWLLASVTTHQAAASQPPRGVEEVSSCRACQTRPTERRQQGAFRGRDIMKGMEGVGSREVLSSISSRKEKAQEQQKNDLLYSKYNRFTSIYGYLFFRWIPVPLKEPNTVVPGRILCVGVIVCLWGTSSSTWSLR